MVSVIIPTYNRPQMTARAVRSVLAQTFQDIEIIVVDDCSPEPITSAGLGDDPRVRVVRHEVNRRAGAARNTGVQAARGDVVAFLDSDDYWLPDKLQSQMALYEKQPAPAGVLIYSTYYHEQGDKWVALPFAPKGKSEALSDYLFIHKGSIHTSTWLAGRALFGQHPFRTELPPHEDWDLLLGLEAAGVQFVHCPVLAGVRTADLREDRISTAVDLTKQRLFLDSNAERLTPPASVLMEAAYISLAQPVNSFLRKQVRQVSYLANSSRLNLAQRVNLVFSFITARAIFKIKTLLFQQPPRAVEFEPRLSG